MKIIHKYFSNLSSKQTNQFEQLGNLYSDWNNKVNLISRKDINFIYTKHILHSLSIAKIIRFNNNTKVLDVGTGGGFPGIPLAIMFPKTNFFLLDSIKKKIDAVNNIRLTLNLNNVTTICERIENINEKFDFIISRGVTNMKRFIEWNKDKINDNSVNQIDNGILYLKGGDLTDEMKNIKYTEYNISSFFLEDFFKTKKIIYYKY